jgi:hypothetical protein
MDAAFKHQVPDDAVLAGDDLRQDFVQILRLDIRQKAQSPEIDADHRQLLVAHQPGGAKHRPVAAEDDQHIRGHVGQRLREIIDGRGHADVSLDGDAQVRGPLN